jgi:CBS domain-containing protein
MKVHEIMTTRPRCVAPDNTLVEAAGLMRELDVGALPVCELDHVTGMVTDRDIVLRAVADGRDMYNATVQDVMSAEVAAVFADQEVEDAARLMEQKQIRRVPVLNRQNGLVGIVSLGDVAVSSNPAFSGIALKEVSEPGGSNAQRAAARMQQTQPPRRSTGKPREMEPAGMDGGNAQDGTPESARGGKHRNRSAATRGGAGHQSQRSGARRTSASKSSRSSKSTRTSRRSSSRNGRGSAARGRKTSARRK